MAKFGSFTWMKEDVGSGVPPTEVYSYKDSGTIVDDDEFVITIKSKYVDVEGITKITEAILEMFERTKDETSK